MTCLLCGCGQSSASAESAIQPEKPEYELSVESNIGQEDCSICGNGGGSLMSYYGKKDSIGIIHLNDLSISDTEVRALTMMGMKCSVKVARVRGSILMARVAEV